MPSTEYWSAGKDLLDVPAGDDVAHRGAAVAGHQHPAGVGHGDDRGGVRAPSGWPADVPAARMARGLAEAVSGRSRWRCSVKDDVALAATCWLLSPALVHSFNVVIQRLSGTSGFRARCGWRGCRSTGRPFGRMPGRTPRRWIPARRRSRRADRQRPAWLRMPVPPRVPAGSGDLFLDLGVPWLRLLLLLACHVFLLHPVPHPEGHPVCPYCHAKGPCGALYAGGGAGAGSEQFGKERPGLAVPGKQPPGQGLRCRAAAPGSGRAAACRSRARRRSPSPSWRPPRPC